MKPTCLVTGSGSGIGRFTADKFAQNGYRVVLVDIDKESCFATENLIRTTCKDAELVTLQADVCQSSEVQKMITGIEGNMAPTHEYPEDVFDKVIATNLKGIWLCMKYEIQQMLLQKSRFDASDALRANILGSIVNISSLAANGPMPEFGPYCASKWGVVGLTKTSAHEYAPHRIQINAVLPSTTDTPMVKRFLSNWPEWQAQTNASYKIGRICTAGEVADVIYWIGSSSCPFMQGEAVSLSGAA